MWARMKTIRIKDSAPLLSDGASRSNPGYGFRINDGNAEDGLKPFSEVVEDFGYRGMNRSNNEMEYEGLIEGIIWAMRLDLVSPRILGDSELVINQLTGKYIVKNHCMNVLHDKAHELLEKQCDLHLDDNLANKAIIEESNSITVYWISCYLFLLRKEIIV